MASRYCGVDVLTIRHGKRSAAIHFAAIRVEGRASLAKTMIRALAMNLTDAYHKLRLITLYSAFGKNDGFSPQHAVDQLSYSVTPSIVIFCAGFFAQFRRVLRDNIWNISAKREPKIGEKDKQKITIEGVTEY